VGSASKVGLGSGDSSVEADSVGCSVSSGPADGEGELDARGSADAPATDTEGGGPAQLARRIAANANLVAVLRASVIAEARFLHA
jgi:hypothetical protein